MLAAALIDRLLHRGIIVGIDGPSYRMRSHQARANALRTATNATTASRTVGKIATRTTAGVSS
jgi:IstB-like ATP binding protein